LVTVGISPNDGFINRNTETGITDDLGVATIDLWPSSLGTTSSQYRIVARNADGSKLLDELVTIPASDIPVWLHDIILLPPPSAKPYDQAVIDSVAENVVKSEAARDSAELSKDAASASADAAAASAIAAAESEAGAETALESFTEIVDTANAIVIEAKAAADTANAAATGANAAAVEAQAAADAANAAATDAMDAAQDAIAGAGQANAAAADATAAANAATAAAELATETAEGAVSDVSGVQGDLNTLKSDFLSTGLSGVKAGATGKALLESETAFYAADEVLGLGTSAFKDIQTSPLDTTPDHVLTTGAFGLGGKTNALPANAGSGFYYVDTITGGPISDGTSHRYTVIHIADSVHPTQMWMTDEARPRAFLRLGAANGTYGDFVPTGSGTPSAPVDLSALQNQIDDLKRDTTTVDGRTTTAQNSANSAQTTANSAKTNADSALTAANKAKSDVQALIAGGGTAKDARVDEITAFGWNMLKAADMAAIKTVLGLGTAAFVNVMTSATQGDAGALMAVGAFGLGASAVSVNSIAIGSITQNGIYTINNVSATVPSDLPLGNTAATYMVLHMGKSPSMYVQVAFMIGATPRMFFRKMSGISGSDLSAWVEPGAGGGSGSADIIQMQADITAAATAANNALSLATTAKASADTLAGQDLPNRVAQLESQIPAAVSNADSAKTTATAAQTKVAELEARVEDLEGSSGGGGGGAPAIGDIILKRTAGGVPYEWAQLKGAVYRSIDYPNIAPYFTEPSFPKTINLASEQRMTFGVGTITIYEADFVGDYLVMRTSSGSEQFMVYDKNNNKVYAQANTYAKLHTTKLMAYMTDSAGNGSFSYNISLGASMTYRAVTKAGTGAIVGFATMDAATDIVFTATGGMAKIIQSTGNSGGVINTPAGLTAIKYAGNDRDGQIIIGGTYNGNQNSFIFDPILGTLTLLGASSYPDSGTISNRGIYVYDGQGFQQDACFVTSSGDVELNFGVRQQINPPTNPYGWSTFPTQGKKYASDDSLWITYNVADQANSYVFFPQHAVWTACPKMHSKTSIALVKGNKLWVFGDHGTGNSINGTAGNVATYTITSESKGKFIVPNLPSPVPGFSYYLKAQ
jgi:hypothetical protein